MVQRVRLRRARRGGHVVPLLIGAGLLLLIFLLARSLSFDERFAATRPPQQQASMSKEIQAEHHNKEHARHSGDETHAALDAWTKITSVSELTGEHSEEQQQQGEEGDAAADGAAEQAQQEKTARAEQEQESGEAVEGQEQQQAEAVVSETEAEAEAVEESVEQDDQQQQQEQLDQAEQQEQAEEQHLGGAAGSASTGAAALATGGEWAGLPAPPAAVPGGKQAPERFLSIQLRLPRTPASYNKWRRQEDMVAFHLAAVEAQLEQAYVGMALAAATNRTFILPQFSCYCDSTKPGGPALHACRAPGHETQRFPVPCPSGQLLALDGGVLTARMQAGRTLGLRERSTLQQADGTALREGAVQLRPHARLLWPACVTKAHLAKTDPNYPGACTQRGLVGAPQGKQQQAGAASFGGGGAAAAPLVDAGGRVLMVPPSLNTSVLLPFLASATEAPLVELSFAGVGMPWHAFSGFRCKSTATWLDAQIDRLVKPWCCSAPRQPASTAALTLDAAALEAPTPISSSRRYRYSGRAGLLDC